ncbi:hypothetical protein QBC40DRAFT_291695 [Triangularia verruculosa]|uniref:Uncharacterized protein n=1 Tax=Triangularia verruculosa TaxID=2587418 RepID=A0AAN6XW70_9PEZI|nr:hypothetical protein QBC40DRAFT_291695 [Triangularia verruculosa]
MIFFRPSGSGALRLLGWILPCLRVLLVRYGGEAGTDFAAAAGAAWSRCAFARDFIIEGGAISEYAAGVRIKRSETGRAHPTIKDNAVPRVTVTVWRALIGTEEPTSSLSSSSKRARVLTNFQSGLPALLSTTQSRRQTPYPEAPLPVPSPSRSRRCQRTTISVVPTPEPPPSYRGIGDAAYSQGIKNPMIELGQKRPQESRLGEFKEKESDVEG